MTAIEVTLISYNHDTTRWCGSQTWPSCCLTTTRCFHLGWHRRMGVSSWTRAPSHAVAIGAKCCNVTAGSNEVTTKVSCPESPPRPPLPGHVARGADRRAAPGWDVGQGRL